MLTAVTMDDLEEHFALHNDAATFVHEPDRRHPDRDYTRSVLEELVQDWTEHHLGYWTVRLRLDDSYLGCGGVRRSTDLWNVYYRLKPAAWGHHYAGEIVRAAAPCAEKIEPGALLQAAVRPTNARSESVVTRIGMTFCGRQPDETGATQLIYQIPAADVESILAITI
jgi:RimJ/RimL family protein N-acetyltransferase